MTAVAASWCVEWVPQDSEPEAAPSLCKFLIEKTPPGSHVECGLYAVEPSVSSSRPVAHRLDGAHAPTPLPELTDRIADK